MLYVCVCVVSTCAGRRSFVCMCVCAHVLCGCARALWVRVIISHSLPLSVVCVRLCVGVCMCVVRVCNTPLDFA